MPNAFTFDGVDVGDGESGSYGVVLEGAELSRMAEPILDVREVPSNFVAIQGTAFKAVRHELRCLVRGTSATDLQAKFDALALLMDPTQGDKLLRLAAYGDRRWRGRFTSPLRQPPRGLLHARMGLEFVAEPGESETLVDETTVIDADPKAVTVPTSGVVGGTVKALPVIYVQNGMIGAATQIVVTNTTTNEAMTIVGNFATSRWVAISTGEEEPGVQDFGRLQIWVSTMGGSDPLALSYTSAMTTRQTGSRWPTLKPGVANGFSVAGLTTGKFRIRYRARYL